MKKLLEVEEKKNLKLLSEEKMKKIREITKEDPIKQCFFLNIRNFF